MRQTKAELEVQVKEAEARAGRAEARLQDVERALRGLYIAINPRYLMEKDIESYDKSFKDQTFSPVLEKIVNYNGQGGRRYSSNPNPVIAYVRDAIAVAEKYSGLRSRAAYMDSTPDDSGDPAYRHYYMTNNGLYFKREDNYSYVQVKVEYDDWAHDSHRKGFIEVGKDVGGNYVPDHYVWDRSQLLWVDPAFVGKPCTHSGEDHHPFNGGVVIPSRLNGSCHVHQTYVSKHDRRTGNSPKQVGNLTR